MKAISTTNRFEAFIKAAGEADTLKHDEVQKEVAHWTRR